MDKGRKDLSEDRGGECLKYLKRGGIEKREGDTKILKEGGGGGKWVKGRVP